MYDENILILAKKYARFKRLSLSTVATYFAGSGDAFARLKRGKSITLRRCLEIIQRFSNRWPPDLEWPSDIPRPSPSSKTKKKSA